MYTRCAGAGYACAFITKVFIGKMYVCFLKIFQKKITIFLQITYAKRKKEVGEKRPLHFSKCQELANYYLGFNGWSVTMKYVSVESNHINNFFGIKSTRNLTDS